MLDCGLNQACYDPLVNHHLSVLFKITVLRMYSVSPSRFPLPTRSALCDAQAKPYNLHQNGSLVLQLQVGSVSGIRCRASAGGESG